MSTTTTHISQVGTVMIAVTDQDRAIEFYTKTLGFELKVDVPMDEQGGRWIEAVPPGAATSVALVPSGEQNPAGRMTNIAFWVDDVQAFYDELREAGVDVDAEILRMGGVVPPMFWFRDQDGNTLQAVEPQPGPPAA